MNEYTSNQVREMLWAYMKAQDGAPMTQKALAAKMGVSGSFLNDILQGNREPQGKVLEFLKLDRIVTYRIKKRRRSNGGEHRDG